MFGFFHEENIGDFVRSFGASQLYQLHNDSGNWPASTEFHSQRPGDAAWLDELQSTEAGNAYQ